ncbi:DUF2157 domain-containing protein [Arcicella aquatica]|uniref:DUF2157 domain-containing protein n=1 Tax=Arcicella aquatica TaxID=217141 RepID=A0ABU5QPA4_9BACT|nr:DUF2157 domain-containing protein [Arcicella aquatica]MEA5258908.1 DUF2157 domain-containing protein [Arcicella aquatica]
MTNQKVLEIFLEKAIISAQTGQHITDFEDSKPFSLHYELKLILYVGIFLFSSGLGIVIYQNLDSIGHTAIVVFISVLVLLCFGFSFWKRKAFSWQAVEQDNPFADFVLVLGCLCFLTLESYLQYQYNLFGEKYGLITFIPAVVFFLAAYVFDHRGVLSMAITAFASWVGVSISPLSVFSKNDFSAPYFIFTSIGLGLFYVVIGLLAEYKQFKKHFSFTYLLLGSNLALVAGTAGIFEEHIKYIYCLIVLAISAGLCYYAKIKQSYVFLLTGVVFAYIALTDVIFDTFPDDFLRGWFTAFYFIASGIGVIYLLFNLKKILKTSN